MKENLYNRSEAVAALNHVEGFHPMELTRVLTKEGGEDQLYLDVKYRKLWFRLAYPLGKIVSSIRSFTENMAIVEARIYLDKGDEQENYVANAFSQKFRTEDPNFGDRFLEMAETAAVGRALSDAGFGVQFADVGEENDPTQVDAGIPVPGMMAQPAIQQNGVTQTSMQEQNIPMSGVAFGQGQQSTTQTQLNMMDQFYQQAQSKGAAIGQNPAETPQMQTGFKSQNQQSVQTHQMQGNQQTFNQQETKPYSTAESLDGSLPVEELVQRMTYEQAAQVVITGNGKFGGKTMGQVAVESPQNLNWFAKSYSGGNHLIPAAARILLNAAMPMAG